VITTKSEGQDREIKMSGARTSPNLELDEAVQRVCARIAPAWPLDRFIAVNPFWGLIDSPLSEVAAKLGSLSGAKLLMPREWYRQAFREGRFREEHLQAALDLCDSNSSVASLVALLEAAEPKFPARARVMDVMDSTLDPEHSVSWRNFVTHSISQFCAAYFDEGQARFGPSREGGLYACWRRQALTDRSPALLMGASSFRKLAHALPVNAREVVQRAVAALDIPPQEQESYLWSLLLDQNGWASWCAYRRWMARLEGNDHDAISELLAIRIAWEWMLFQSGGETVAHHWKSAMAKWPRADEASACARKGDWLLQLALEVAWREPVVDALVLGFAAARADTPSVQAIFCIDVRSEVIRRALEATAPSIATLGFAGFFGVPLDYQPLGAPSARPQLPGLLAPRLRACDTGLEPKEGMQRARRLERGSTWKSFKTDSLSTFTFVEALGLTYAGNLLKDSFGLNSNVKAESRGFSRAIDQKRKPRLAGYVGGGALELEARCDLAAGMLRGMSLTHDFARIVLLAGHGSSTSNNPHAAGLDCGACCGQTGEVNARVAAALLNEPEVRKGLARRAVHVPESTWFVSALHNTTTDEFELFDLDELPPSHQGDIETLRRWLTEAGARARAERATLLGIDEHDPLKIHRAVVARTTDWAQVRAEWGLANNAAFVVAPREHCRHLNFQGRSFLHEYRYREDEGFGVLELIMTAPMVVTHWINFQYYASTVDNSRYGSGNKVLHNVVGGHLGVFEGNGGDLRIGLPMQSLHDGSHWVHTPLRLSVFIEAPRSAIDAVLEKYASVRALVTNGWISLFQLDDVESAVYLKHGELWRRAT